MKTSQDSNSKSVGKIINELSRTAHVYFHSEFKNHNIGHAQIKTLLLISRKEGISQLELSENLKLDKSSVTSQLQILEKNGYIIKQRCEKDARKHQIILTDKTKEILEPLKLVFASWTDSLLKGFNETEKLEVLEYLTRMQQNAQVKLELIKKQN